MRKIENAFTIEHLQIAKMIAMGYSNKAIMNKIYYSIRIVSKALKDFYKRYEITGSSTEKRKQLHLILQRKLKHHT